MSSDVAPSVVPASVFDDAVRAGTRLVALRVGNAVVAFVASVIVARALGPAGRGAFALPVAIVGIAVALAHLGVEHAHVYLASRGTSTRALWANATLTGGLLGGVAAAVLVAAGVFAGDSLWPRLPLVWIVVAAAQLPLLLQTLLWSGVLQLHGRVNAAAAAPLCGNAILTVVAGAMAASGALTPFRALVLWVSVNAVTWGVLLVAGRAIGLAGGRAEVSTARASIAFGVKAYVGVTFFFLLLRVDQVLVERIVGPVGLGRYSLAVALAELAWLATDPFAASVLHHQVVADERDDGVLGDATARVAVLVGIAFAVAAALLSRVAIPLVYGTGFEAAVGPFILLLPGVVALAIQRPLGPLLVKRGRMGLVAVFGAVTLGVNVVLTIVLLHVLGIRGAAVASSVCYIGLAVAYVAVTRGERGWRTLVPTSVDVARVARALRPSR